MSDLIVLHGCATVQLTHGKNTLVDEHDYPKVASHRWHFHCSGYACRNKPGGKGRALRLHREILSASVGPCPSGQECRHLNGDRLDNRAKNLVWGTHAENMADAVRHGTISRHGKGRPFGHDVSPEARAKIAAAGEGRQKSSEHRAKISAAIKAVWEARRAAGWRGNGV